MKLIKINQDHYIGVSTELEEGYCGYNTVSKTIFTINKQLVDMINDVNIDLTTNKRITHSTEPESFGDGWMQSIKPLLLSEVKELLGEVDVEKRAEEFAKHHSIYDSAQDDTEYGYREGYNQCLEDNKEKKYTKEDLRDAFNAGNDY